jgi:hypothetical protein
MLGCGIGTHFLPSGTVAITLHQQASKWEGRLCSKWLTAHTCDEREREIDKEDGGELTAHRKRIRRQL